jgi:anti-anti-sigma factor
MEIAEFSDGGHAIVALEGRLDTTTAPQAEAALLAMIERGPLIVDLAQLRYVSSAGLRVLLKAAKQAKAGGRRFAICALQPSVREVFLISGFDKVIATFETRADAMAAGA